jgi:cytidylate kinase
MIITIDGPTASGKSTIARELAQRLHFKSLSSGLLFRAMAYILMKYFNYEFDNLENVAFHDLDEAFGKKFSYTLTANGGTVMFNDKDITSLLKDPSLDQPASIIATLPEVRERIAKIQQTMVQHQNVIVEGRDVGSVVFPNAVVKFFLTAETEVRAHRWQQEQKQRGKVVQLPVAQQMIIERDKRDMNRSIAPLVAPEGAYIVDSSSMTVEETIKYMMSLIKRTIDGITPKVIL